MPMRSPTPIAHALAVLLLAGCSPAPALVPPTATVSSTGGVVTSASTPGATLTSTFAAQPTPAPTPVPTPHHVALSFDADAVGGLPADFVDVSTEGSLPAWVYQGNWKVALDGASNHVLLHDDVRQQPNVSFVRYKGSDMGTSNGVMPDAYFASVSMRPINSPNNYPPTGDQGVQFYFVNYEHYVELVVKPDMLEIWECNGGEPKTTKGWKRLWWESLTTKAGDVRHIGALVDKRAGTFTPYLDGKAVGAAQTSTVIAKGDSWVALRGIGNVVSFDDFAIDPR